jgi:hypothetical protein
MKGVRARICQGCWQQMHVPVPLRGIASAPFRAFGIRPSRMNPNTCTICEMMFTKVMKARQVTIDATVLLLICGAIPPCRSRDPPGRIQRCLTPSTTNAPRPFGITMGCSIRLWATRSSPFSIFRSATMIIPDRPCSRRAKLVHQYVVDLSDLLVVRAVNTHSDQLRANNTASPSGRRHPPPERSRLRTLRLRRLPRRPPLRRRRPHTRRTHRTPLVSWFAVRLQRSSWASAADRLWLALLA